MSHPFLVVPTIKVVLETLPSLKLRDHHKIIKQMFHSTVYFSLFYGLTFEPEDQENPTYVNSSLLTEDIPSGKQLRSFVASLRLQSYDLRRGIRVHILKLLKLLGEADMGLILNFINDIVSANDVTKLVAYNAIDILKYIIKFCEADFNGLIVHWAEALMKSLNPNKPEIRKFCQKMSTSAMKSLLKRYNFCCFHKDTQHLFVPGATHEIIIYDLRTAMRWKSLKGHTNRIDCLAVHDNGQTLASLSGRDKELKFWKIGASGFFENLLRSSTELTKSVKLKEEPPAGTELKLVWLNDKTVEVSAPKVGWRVQAAY